MSVLSRILISAAGPLSQGRILIPGTDAESQIGPGEPSVISHRQRPRTGRYMPHQGEHEMARRRHKALKLQIRREVAAQYQYPVCL